MCGGNGLVGRRDLCGEWRVALDGTKTLGGIYGCEYISIDLYRFNDSSNT